MNDNDKAISMMNTMQSSMEDMLWSEYFSDDKPVADEIKAYEVFLSENLPPRKDVKLVLE